MPCSALPGLARAARRECSAGLGDSQDCPSDPYRRACPPLSCCSHLASFALKHHVRPDLLDTSFRTNVNEYVLGRVPLYGKFELAFQIGSSIATNPMASLSMLTRHLASRQDRDQCRCLAHSTRRTDWARARTMPCFVLSAREEIGRRRERGSVADGEPDWRCRLPRSCGHVALPRSCDRCEPARRRALKSNSDSAPSASRGMSASGPRSTLLRDLGRDAIRHAAYQCGTGQPVQHAGIHSRDDPADG